MTYGSISVGVVGVGWFGVRWCLRVDALGLVHRYRAAVVA